MQKPINLPSYLTISSDINLDLNRAIQEIKPDKIAILVDDHTIKNCLPIIGIEPDLVVEIPSGELHKTLETCSHIWKELTDAGFTRKSLLINLGGGVIGDMGGFAASTYKRGMSFINVPTTLLSQVDASIGGKLGVDFNGLKNHIGVFQDPFAVLVFPKFLETLPKRELKSGFAEVIKHALIRSEAQWKYLSQRSFEELNWEELIPKSIAIKNEVVSEDPFENGVRKILNYGHTIGHAYESRLLGSDRPLLHGEAIALGMMMENQIAVKMGLFSAKDAEEIKEYIWKVYDLPEKLPAFDELASTLRQDKKNDAHGISFSLLEKIGHCTYDVYVDEPLIKEVLK